MANTPNGYVIPPLLEALSLSECQVLGVLNGESVFPIGIWWTTVKTEYWTVDGPWPNLIGLFLHSYPMEEYLG